jgi:hypothetical protein
MVLVFETFFCDGERIEIIDESVGTQCTCFTRTKKKKILTHTRLQISVRCGTLMGAKSTAEPAQSSFLVLNALALLVQTYKY